MSTSGEKEAMEKAFNQAAENLIWPMLTRTNYQEWASHIQCNLEAMFLWDAISEDKVERRRDRLALGAMLRGVPTEMHPMLLNKKMVKEAWEAIKSMHLGADRVKEIVVAIEMFCDLDTLTIEELIGRLRAVEDHFELVIEKVSEKAGSLLLTKEEWTARNKSRMVIDSSSSSSQKKDGGHYVRKDELGTLGGGEARDSGCKTKPKEERQEAAHHAMGDIETGALLVAQLEEAGCRVEIDNGVMQVFERRQAVQQHRGILIRAERRNRLYVMKPKLTSPIYLLSKMEEATCLWHARYEHLNLRSLHELASKEMVQGLPWIRGVEQVCDGCVLGKQHRTPFPRASAYHVAAGLELVHRDLCGQITPPTLGGKSYFLLIVDDFSRYMWLELLSTKDEALVYFKKVVAVAEVELGHWLKAFRTDCGGEFNSGTNKASRRYRIVADLLDSTEEMDDVEYSGLCLVAAGEPGSVEEAMTKDCWRKAMKVEMQAIEENKTWDGVEFEEVFALVARIETVRVLLALAAKGGWEVHHMDVKSAFLNGDLVESVYVKQPPGFIVRRGDKVLKLRKALYGLR
ncbi:uncharacterized protein [Miscanthus floridulus]|uniref:uncharacterized protein n=1 Tax=Miscanthus floridulus TaxID=154761 RepID=UPI00345A7FFB